MFTLPQSNWRFAANTSTSQTARILIADEMPIIRYGLRTWFSTSPNFEVVGEAKNGPELCQMARLHRPNIIVWELSLPWNNPAEDFRALKQEIEDVRILAFTASRSPEYLVLAEQCGASAVVQKENSLECLAGVIESLTLTPDDGSRNELESHPIYSTTTPAPPSDVAGESVAVESLSGKEHRGSARATMHDRSRGRELTPRELQVVRWVALGKTSKEIASILNIKTQTVNTHRANVAKKLNIHRVAELTQYVYVHGLMEDD